MAILCSGCIIKRMKKIKVISWILFFLALILFFLYRWLVSTFAVSLEAIIFTLRSPIEGADTSFVLPAVTQVLLPSVIIFAVAYGMTRLINKLLRKKSERLSNAFQKTVNVILCLSLLVSLYWVGAHMHVDEYIDRRIHATAFYEDNYVDPAKVDITDPEKKKNLIFVYVESLETKYAAKTQGGAQETNLIPNFTRLAKDNLYFSNTSGFGGYISDIDLTGWTIASMFASSSGLPLAIPIMQNRMAMKAKFAPSISTLGDILNEKGYNQEFLCGSDAEFGGRKTLFTQHGNYEIFDYFTAQEKGYIPEGYKVWWGYEDKHLYEIAKDEITRLASKEQPFNFTMLTVDTHNVGGYVCDLCDDKYDDQIANVIDCADRQFNDFMNWLKEQEFYEDTMIVVVGDHPRMDDLLVEEVPYSERAVYNCFINAEYAADTVKTKNRVALAMDLFPTVLSGMGFKIPGDRLGLGTDLFSSTPTYAEEMGLEAYEEELKRYSQFLTDILAYTE